MVNGVEGLGTKFQVQPFGDLEPLEHGQVDIVVVRSEGLLANATQG